MMSNWLLDRNRQADEQLPKVARLCSVLEHSIENVVDRKSAKLCSSRNRWRRTPLARRWIRTSIDLLLELSQSI